MSLRLEFAETMSKIVLKDKKLTVVVGDISHGILKNFRKISPKNYFNIGICEPSMISFGAGLSKAGLTPVMHTIAPFLIERCAEQIKIDFSYNNLNGNFISVGSSFDYSKLGCTHHSYSDFAIIKNIPNTQIFYPSGKNEFYKLFLESYNKNKINYFRLPSEMHSEIIDEKKIEVGKAIKISNGNRLTICCFGPHLTELKKIVSMFKKKMIDIELLYYPTIKPFDAKSLIKSLKKTKKLFVIEEHCLNGGGTGSVQDAILKNSLSIKSNFLNLENSFVKNYGDHKDLKKQLGFSEKNYIKIIKNLLNK